MDQQAMDLGSYACIASSSAETIPEAGAESWYKQKKGSSLKLDHWIIGCKVYTDAAWKNTTIQKQLKENRNRNFLFRSVRTKKKQLA